MDEIMKLEIIKVKIKMGTVEVELTLDEAKELQRTLNNAFGNPSPVWFPYWPTPIPNPYWTTTYGDSTMCVESTSPSTTAA